jgi:signal transduction histidine kinase
VGFDAVTTTTGTGLQGMADRLAAVGGSLDVRSAPGTGTTVHGRLPV